MAASAVLLLGSLAICFRFQVVGNGALALATLGGIFTAYVVHTELFYPDNWVWLALVGLAAFFALFVAFKLIDDYRSGGLALSAVASLPLVALICSQVWPMLTSGISTQGGLLHWGSPLMWIGLIGICVGSAFAIHLFLRVADASRLGGFVLLAATAFLAFALIWLNGNHIEGGDGYYAESWEGPPKIAVGHLC